VEQIPDDSHNAQFYRDYAQFKKHKKHLDRLVDEERDEQLQERQREEQELRELQRQRQSKYSRSTSRATVTSAQEMPLQGMTPFAAGAPLDGPPLQPDLQTSNADSTQRCRCPPGRPSAAAGPPDQQRCRCGHRGFSHRRCTAACQHNGPGAHGSESQVGAVATWTRRRVRRSGAQ
jgi:hypothetical protein